MKKTTLKPPVGLSNEAKLLWSSTLKQWPIEREQTLLVCLRSACFALDRLRAAEQALARTRGAGCYLLKGIPKQHPLTLVIRDSNKMLLDNLRALSLDLEAVNKIKGVDDPDFEPEEE